MRLSVTFIGWLIFQALYTNLQNLHFLYVEKKKTNVNDFFKNKLITIK